MLSVFSLMSFVSHQCDVCHVRNVLESQGQKMDMSKLYVSHVTCSLESQMFDLIMWGLSTVTM